jgi:hypothetical protein
MGLGRLAHTLNECFPLHLLLFLFLDSCGMSWINISILWNIVDLERLEISTLPSAVKDLLEFQEACQVRQGLLHLCASRVGRMARGQLRVSGDPWAN